MYSHILKLCLLLTSSVITHSAVLKNGVEIPQLAIICRRSQNDLNVCLKDTLNILIKKISKDGIPEIKFPPLDPWKVDEFHVKNSGEPFKLGLTFTDSNSFGLSTLEVTNVKSNFNNPKHITIDIDFRNDKAVFKGNYNAEGFISDLPILGKGSYTGTVMNISGTLSIRAHIVKKDGEEFLHIDRMISRPVIGDVKVQMTNENNKYPELSNLLVSLLNQFWRPIYQEALPYYEKVSDQIMTSTFNKITLKIPYDQLIPK